MLETFCQGLSTSSTNAVPQETVYEQVSVDLLIHGQLTVTVYMQDFFFGGGGGGGRGGGGLFKIL